MVHQDVEKLIYYIIFAIKFRVNIFYKYKYFSFLLLFLYEIRECLIGCTCYLNKRIRYKLKICRGR